MEKDPSQNQRNLRRLLMSLQASYGRLNLLIAICDNWKYRDELMGSYEQELAAKGTSCHRVRIDPQQPSLKQSLQDLVLQESALLSVDQPAIVTVLGADELLEIRLNEPKSAQEQFFFSAQWTREGLREFKFPIVIWFTPEIATSLSQQAPDFWSWRGGVFEFSQPIEPVITPIKRGSDDKDKPNEELVKTDPIALQKQIDELESQDPNSPLLASLYNSLGRAYEDAIRYKEAEAPYQKALDLYKQQFGDRHLGVANSLNNLAGLYHLQERYAEAEPLFKQALLLWQELLGDRHPYVATSFNNLAGLYHSQGRYAEAEPLYKQALLLRQELLGDRHPDVAGSLNNLAGLYESQGRYAEAEPLYKQAFLLSQELLADRHPYVVGSLFNLALLYHKMQRDSEALPLIQRTIQIYEQTLGVNHPETKAAQSWLAAIKKKGKEKKGKKKKGGFGVRDRF